MRITSARLRLGTQAPTVVQLASCERSSVGTSVQVLVRLEQQLERVLVELVLVLLLLLLLLLEQRRLSPRRHSIGAPAPVLSHRASSSRV